MSQIVKIQAVDITVDACASCDDERSMHSVERLIGDEPGKRQGSCCETKPNNSHPEVFGVYTEVSPSRQGQHLPVTSPADTIVQDSATMPSEREGVSQDMATSQYVDLSTDLNQQQKSAVRFSVRSLGPESSTLGLSTAPTLRAPYPTGVAAELKYIQDLAAGTSRKTAETQHPVEGIESFNASHSKSEKEQSSIDSAIALEAAQRRDALLSTVRESQRMRNQLKIKHEAKQRQQAAKWDDSTFFSPEVLHCVEKLRSLQGEPDSLLKMIYADYPPKDGRCIYACGNFKKTVQRAISHYHPDKQDDELHGHDWVNICDEICKELTRLYTKL